MRLETYIDETGMLVHAQGRRRAWRGRLSGVWDLRDAGVYRGWRDTEAEAVLWVAGEEAPDA